MDEIHKKTSNGIGHNSNILKDKSPTAEAIIVRYEFMLDQAVRFLDRLSNIVISADTTLTTKAINGKNNVVRHNGVRAASVDLQKLVKETKHWHTVIETMKQGKDVHSQHNGGCKSSKLEIVGGEAYDFGQYLVNKTLANNSDGKNYIKKVTSHDD